MPRLARGRARLEGHLNDIIDGGDLVRLAERELMAPLDAEARRLVSAAASRVSLVTAVSPRAAIDMIFVLVNTLTLIRRLAVLYGGRPGTLGVIRLLRQTVSHLAVTGGVAVSDSIVQQVIGHGVAARLSAKLGEGVLNGLLTARLGLLAIEQTRPLPFSALPRPALNDIAGGLIRQAGRAEDPPKGRGRSSAAENTAPARFFGCAGATRRLYPAHLTRGHWLCGSSRPRPSGGWTWRPAHRSAAEQPETIHGAARLQHAPAS